MTLTKLTIGRLPQNPNKKEKEKDDICYDITCRYVDLETGVRTHRGSLFKLNLNDGVWVSVVCSKSL